VHIVAYAQEKRGNFALIEDRILLRDVEIQLRCDGKKVRSVYQAPSRQLLPHTEEDGYCRITLPEASGYALVVFEY